MEWMHFFVSPTPNLIRLLTMLSKFGYNMSFYCFQFVKVLNSKKAKLRQLRDRLSKRATAEQLPEEEEEESTDRTESFDEGSDEEAEKNSGGTSSSKDAPASKPRGRKRK